jgi:drug/metabolite transporter superfamily protein YnfA
VNRVRGIVMLLAGCFALYEGWRMLTGRRAVLAIILGVVALGLAAWHLTRKEPKRLV